MKKTLLQTSAILGLSVMAALISAWTVGKPAAETCDPSALQPGEICLQDVPTDKPVVWIDARSRSDWQQNGLPGSILWNLDAAEDVNAMENEAVMKIFTTPYVVVYCNDKGCGTSSKIANRIREMKDLQAEVHVLHGGWKTLQAAGRVPAR